MLKNNTLGTRVPSLIRRLILASALLLPILLFFSAFMLNRAYVNSLDSAEKDALEAQIYALIAVAESNNQRLELPELMTNPRFEQPVSGLYARVINKNLVTIWQSNSLETAPYTFTVSSTETPGVLQDMYANTLARPGMTLPKHLPKHRSVRLATIWETRDGDGIYTFEVIHSQRAKHQEIRKYRHTLALWLGGMAMLLLLTQFLVVRWGLKPLASLANDIDQIEEGKSQALKKDYPVEIRPVTDSVNKLLQSEHEQRERFKNALADLAHSLKTPLSVIRSQLDGTTQRDHLVDEQIERMTNIISHQLRRANAEVKAVFGVKTLLLPVAERLISALGKVYKDKEIVFDIDIKSTLECAMEENDLMEVIGNILENACKYGNGQVSIRAEKIANDIKIDVEDDGAGVPSAVKTEILQRGARADSSASGQGIGLAVAVNILSSYNGSLSVENSQNGGAVFSIYTSAP